MLQQAPSSKLQPALLLSSSHHLSLDHCGDPHPLTMVVIFVVVVDQFICVVVELGVVVFADQLLWVVVVLDQLWWVEVVGFVAKIVVLVGVKVVVLVVVRVVVLVVVRVVVEVMGVGFNEHVSRQKFEPYELYRTWKSAFEQQVHLSAA